MNPVHQIQRRFRRRTRPGAAPGAVVTDPEASPPRLKIFAYGPEELEEFELAGPEEIAPLREKYPVLWLDVAGLGDAGTIRRVGELFGFHPLALEDVVNTHQRPKFEDYVDYCFMVLRMLSPGENIETEQLGLFWGERFVVSFQERPGDCLDPVRHRIRNARGHIRALGADYLAYALIDVVIDAYFPRLEKTGALLDELEDEITSSPQPDAMGRILELKRILLMLRRAIWPLRDEIAKLSREPHPLVSDQTRIFLRDCYDHTVQIIDLIESSREICADLRDYYLSVVNNRMSEVMKVLTIIATIFIPLGFIAGVYGMNFDPNVSPWNMPLLRWPFGYPLIMGLMGALAGGMMVFFWRRGWLR